MNSDLLPAISLKQTSAFVESGNFLFAEISFSSFFYVGVVTEGGSQGTDHHLKPHIELAFMESSFYPYTSVMRPTHSLTCLGTLH